jgi:hypothetical protein
METVLDILKREIETCGISRYRISEETGVDVRTLHRIAHGESCRAETVDILLKYFGYKIVQRKRGVK